MAARPLPGQIAALPAPGQQQAQQPQTQQQKAQPSRAYGRTATPLRGLDYVSLKGGEKTLWQSLNTEQLLATGNTNTLLSRGLNNVKFYDGGKDDMSFNVRSHTTQPDYNRIPFQRLLGTPVELMLMAQLDTPLDGMVGKKMNRTSHGP